MKNSNNQNINSKIKKTNFQITNKKINNINKTQHPRK